jgi:hypothetical protein
MRCYGEVRRVRDGFAELGARRISGWESNERRRVKVTGGGGKTEEGKPKTTSVWLGLA